MSSSDTNSTGRTAGLFDIRVIIGSLLTLYGLILTVLGLIGASDADLNRTGGVNINLWAGLGMLVVGIGFVVWARVRPIVVAAPASNETTPEPPAGE
jgi:hypothetical protein